MKNRVGDGQRSVRRHRRGRRFERWRQHGALRVRVDAQHDVQVARLAAAEPRSPLPTQADLRARVHAGRNPDRQSPGLLYAPLPAALDTWALEQAARAPTGRTRRRRDDRAEDRLLLAPDLAGATAPRARFLAGARLGAAARAALTVGQARNIDLLLDADERLFEGDREVVAKIVAAVRTLAPRATADASAEESVENVPERHVGEIDARPAARLDSGVAEHVVSPPASWVGQHGVGLARFLEPRGGDCVIRVAVRVRVHGDLPESALQVLGSALPA